MTDGTWPLYPEYCAWKCQNCQIGIKHAGNFFFFLKVHILQKWWWPVTFKSLPWLFCVLKRQVQALFSVVPSFSSSWSTGRSLFQKLDLFCFLTLFSALKKSQICCLSVFKLGGGRLGDCLCVVALVYSPYMLYLNFSDWFTLDCKDPSIIPAKCFMLGSQEKGWPLGCLSTALLEPRVGFFSVCLF